MMRRSRSSLTVLLLCLVTLAAFGAAAHGHPHPLGLETKRMPYSFWAEPMNDDIYHVPTGTKLSFPGMMDIVSSGRVIFIGEIHNNIHSHRMQLEILEELNRRFPGKVAIGMEMFREPQQASLDRWTKGELSEPEFLKDSGWFNNWSANYGYYRDIMDFARDEEVDVIALNPSMELQRAVGMSLDQELSDELAASVPEMDSSDPYQQAMVKAVYGAHEGGEKMQKAFMRIQLLWEENMAERIVEYLGSPQGEGKIMVVLAGEAHVEYGFGVPKKVIRRMPLPYFIVLPSILSMPHEEPEGVQLYMNIEEPEIPLLSGDFIWAVPYELLDDRKVRMGIKMAAAEAGVAVEEVLDGSPASLAGIMPGDVLVSIDNLDIEYMSDVFLVISTKRFGDTINVVVRRDGEELTISARFTEPAG